MFAFWIVFIAESLLISLCLDAECTALSEPIYILLTLINVFSLLAFGSRELKTKKATTYFVLALFIRMAFFIWVQYFSDVFLLPNAGIDEYTFYYSAMRRIIRGISHDPYSTVVAYEAKLVGLSIFYLRIINLFLSMQALVVFSEILSMLDISESTYDRTMQISCILPSYALISVLLLRESLIILLLTISLFYFVKWWKSNFFTSFLIAILFGVLAAMFHSGSIVLATGEVLVLMFSKRNMQGREFRLDRKRIFLLLLCMVVMLSLISVLGASFGVDSVDDIYEASAVRIEGGASYDATVIPIGGVLGIILNSPFHAIFFLGSPFPWQWRSLSDIMAFSISAVFYLYVFWNAFKNIKQRNEGASLLNALFVISIIGMIVFGWGVANAGTALRHRDKLVFVYLLMLAIINNKNDVSTDRR